MTGEHDSLRWTRSEAVSAKSCHVILETLSPECVEKISRYLESSAGHSGQDKVSNEPAAAESDSGDSLFITQKPVPEAVRSARPRHYSSRSDPISPRAVEESEEDSPSYSFHGESKTDRRRRKKKHRLPKYSFPFLAERERKPRSTLLAGQQNKHLHNYAMGGFFKCVKELWQDYGRGNLESSLPTVDMDEDYISPLSEQEERSEDEDIKVVERKHLVAPSKAKSRQTWWNQLKQQRATKACNARQEYSQGRHKLQDKVSILKTTVLYSETENSDDGESSCRVVVEREEMMNTWQVMETFLPKHQRQTDSFSKIQGGRAA
ncbi:aspartoacylase isoform X2 [Micropterus salmoides]|uniref:aspartoacylase isoform X2 n=1 Tax=Micropterus salmoides TaxID=27706 RepID=UPI0018EAA670|nr:aspartoacylase isoform X2 [Micropterus salmoides]